MSHFLSHEISLYLVPGKREIRGVESYNYLEIKFLTGKKSYQIKQAARQLNSPLSSEVRGKDLCIHIFKYHLYTLFTFSSCFLYVLEVEFETVY